MPGVHLPAADLDRAMPAPRKLFRCLLPWRNPDNVRPNTLPCDLSTVRLGSAAETHTEIVGAIRYRGQPSAARASWSHQHQQSSGCAPLALPDELLRLRC